MRWRALEALMDGGLREVLVTGFLTTSCVRKTALDLRRRLPASVETLVFDHLIASRASSYFLAPAGAGRHAEALREMEAAGVEIVQGLREDRHNS